MTLKRYLQEEEWQKNLATRQGDYSDVPEFSKAVAETQFAVSKKGKKVIFDNVNGAGQTSNNQNVIYMGFVAMMTPSDFLKIALDDRGTQDRRADELIDGFEHGISIGSPTLYLDVESETPRITGHEGRGRMKAIKQYLGNELIPVHVILNNGYRNRDLDTKMIHKIKGMIKTERGDHELGGLIFKEIVK